MMTIDDERCQVCGTCAGVCPADAIVIGCGKAYIRHEACTDCRLCESVCPVKAIVFVQDD